METKKEVLLIHFDYGKADIGTVLVYTGDLQECLKEGDYRFYDTFDEYAIQEAEWMLGTDDLERYGNTLESYIDWDRAKEDALSFTDSRYLLLDDYEDDEELKEK